MTIRSRLFLVTESPAPSGVGEHMLTLAEGLREALDGGSIHVARLAVLAVWAAIAATVTVRAFRWE